MPKVTSQVNSLTSGEWSRKSLGRFDLTKYQSGAKKLENFLINQLGGVSFRPGTRYIASTKDNGWARLFPFQYSSDQDYVVEAGNLYFRIYNNDTSALTITGYGPYVKALCHFNGANNSTTLTDELGHTLTATNCLLKTAVYKFSTASLYFDGVGDYVTFTPHDDWNISASDFCCEFQVRFDNKNTASQDIIGGADDHTWLIRMDSGTLKFFASSNGSAWNIASDVAGSKADWANDTFYHIRLTWDGANYRIFVDGTIDITVASALGIIGSKLAFDYFAGADIFAGYIDEFRWIKGNSISITNFTAPTTPYAIISSTETATPYLEADIPDLHFAQNNDVLYITHPNYWPRKLSRTSATYFDLSVVSFVRGPFLDDNITTTTITPTSATGATELTASSAIFSANHVGSYWKIAHDATHSAVVKIDTFVSTVHVHGTVQKEPDGTAGNIGGTNAYTTWAEGTFSGLDTSATIQRGFPATVCFHEQRLYYGCTTHEPQKFWGSYIGAYDSFDDRATTANYAITFEVATEQRNAIRWLSSGNKILNIGTTGGTFSVSSGDSSAPISPTNIMVNRDTNYGVANLMPKRISSFLYYIQRDYQKLRELSYNFQIDSTISSDMTLLAEHILKDGTKVIDLDHQQAPNDRIWCVRYDGEMAVLTRNPEQEVMGWCRIIAGDDMNGTGKFESVCVIPKSQANDQVWVIVKRKIGTATKRFIEYFTPEDFTDKWDAVRCDSCVTRDTAKTITGMTNVSPGVFSCTAHGFTTGDQVKIDGVVLADVAGVASKDINGIYLLVEGADADKFTLTTLLGVAINPTTATGYGTYVSGGEIRLMTAAVTGLGHLVGETVVAQVDGYIPSTETYVVQAGGLLTLSAKAAVVHCGLGYIGEIQLLKLSDGSPTGTGQTKTRRIYKGTLRLDHSQGLSLGRNTADLDDLNYDVDGSASTNLYTGDISKVFNTSWAKDDEIIIMQQKPLPANILCIVLESEVTS